MKKFYSSLFIGLFSFAALFANEIIVCKMKPLGKTSQKVECVVTTAEKVVFFYLIDGDVSAQLQNDFAQKPKKYDKAQGILTLSSVKDKIQQKVVAQKPFTEAVVEIEKNGVYTICAENKKGDVCVSIVQVSNIDKTPPSKISEFTSCPYENGQRAFFWKNPDDEDFAGSELRILGTESKWFPIPKDIDHIIIDDVDQNAECLIVARDDVGNLSEPAELFGLVMRPYIKSIECEHKVDKATYEEPDSVCVEIKGFDLICSELDDFELSSDTLEFKNLRILRGLDDRCLLSFDRPEEKGEYSFSVKVKALSDMEEKTFNISTVGTKPIPVEFSLSNSSIGSRSDKNQSLTIKGYNLDKLNLNALTVCWKEGKDDIITGRKKLNGNNSLTVEYSYGGIDNYPDVLSASELWKDGRELVVKYGSEVIWTKEIELDLQPVLKANGAPLPEWVGECRFDYYGFFSGGDTINDEFLRTPGKGNKVSFSFSNNILTVCATYSHPDLKADEYNLKVDIKVDKARRKAVILYYCNSWRNYLGNWERDEVVSRDDDDVQRAWEKLEFCRFYIYKEKE